MASLTLRLVKNEPLTNQEVDDNFTNLNNDIISRSASLNANVGILSQLSTGNKTNTVFAINEVFANVGILSQLTTTVKSNIVAALNETISRSSTSANITGGNISNVVLSNTTITTGNVSVSNVTASSILITGGGTVSGVTLTNSTWSGNPIAVDRGGTGLTGYTAGDILYASGSTTISRLADVGTGNALISGGVGSDPLWGKVDLATHITGTLPVANGGTGNTIFASGNLLIGNGTGAIQSAIPGIDYARPNTTSTWSVNQNYQANLLFNGGPRTIGTNDGNTFSILTNSVSRISITGTGIMTYNASQIFNVVTPAAVELNLATSNYFKKTISTTTTFTAVNPPPSGTAYSFTLEVVMQSGATAINWGSGLSGVTWPNGTAPSLTTNKTHLFMFVTTDGGTTWRASSLINY